MLELVRILDVAGIATFRNLTCNVGAAVTISESGIEHQVLELQLQI